MANPTCMNIAHVPHMTAHDALMSFVLAVAKLFLLLNVLSAAASRACISDNVLRRYASIADGVPPGPDPMGVAEIPLPDILCVCCLWSVVIVREWFD